MNALQDSGLNPHFEGLHHGETDELRALRLKQAAENESLRAALKVAGEALERSQESLGRFTCEEACTNADFDVCDDVIHALQQIKEAQR